jgi:L-asparaginase / beta-aspartyl-peptidase
MYAAVISSGRGSPGSNVACATSTGGITGKMPGRVGDAPLVGLGGYADNRVGACSATGHGEGIMKTCLCARAAWHMEAGCSAQTAAEQALATMQERVGSCGGLIVVDRHGNVGRFATTPKMAWASARCVVPGAELERASGYRVT